MSPRNVLPKTTPISEDDTHRLIPHCFYEEGESVLSRLGLPPAQMEHLFQLDDATNAQMCIRDRLYTDPTYFLYLFQYLARKFAHASNHSDFNSRAVVHDRLGAEQFSRRSLRAWDGRHYGHWTVAKLSLIHI